MISFCLSVDWRNVEHLWRSKFAMFLLDTNIVSELRRVPSPWRGSRMAGRWTMLIFIFAR